MTIAQSTAVDVVGVGLENGCVLVHNLRYDETLMKFQQDWGPVTAISFRQGELIDFNGFWCGICVRVCMHLCICVRIQVSHKRTQGI